MPKSCNWPCENKLMIQYHDTGWGLPTHDDRKLFEFLLLDNAQAGLSWLTICYAFMQSAGLVNDHLTCCFRYTQSG